MEYVAIFNGLGNQMSQYAFYLSKKKHNPHCGLYIIDNPNEHNGYELERIFGIHYKDNLWDKICKYIHDRGSISRFHKIILKLGITKVHEPLNYNYTPDLHKKHKGIKIFWGGWHSEKNFLDVEEIVRQTFTFPVSDDKNYTSILDHIRRDNHSVSIHVRRGDYVNIRPDDYYQFGDVATETYYSNAIEYINSRITNPHYYVFSNDLDWCKENIKADNITFISGNLGSNSWRDMQLMSECKHHIIANSSFSWWGAWLSKYEKDNITIRPKWFIRNVQTNDIYPDRWIEIDY